MKPLDKKLKWFRSQWRYELEHFKGKPEGLASSFSLGVFLGFTPTIGFQTMLALALSRVFKKSFTAIYLGSAFITGIPPIIPFVYLFCYKVGVLFLRGVSEGNLGRGNVPNMFSWEIIPFYGIPLLVGCFIMAVVGALIAYPISLFVLNRIIRNKK